MRNFSDVKTIEDIQDAMTGAKVISYQPNKMVFETPLGERFNLKFATQTIPITVGDMTLQYQVKQTILVFANEESNG